MDNFYCPAAYNTNTDQNNFGTAFRPLMNMKIQNCGYDPKSFFVNYDFENRNHILHNNLDKILLNEEIREYSVMIDSKDRNYQVYTDPFNYEVKFRPLPKSRDKNCGKITIHEDPSPTIYDNFTNVRYIKLDSIILPFYTKIKLENEMVDGEIVENWKIDTTKMLTDDLYVVLSLGEYTDINYRSTNDVLADSFAIIYYNNRLNDTHYLGSTSNGIKFFPKDQLAKIDKLKISFMDPYGNPIRCPHLDKEIKSNMVCTCKDDSYDVDCFKHNLFHPLNPIFQHHLHFKIGVVEPRLNKLTFS